jgi:hypothetical protein
MSEQFITMVIKMRAAQKEFFENRTRGNMMIAVKLESQVDRWLEGYVSEKVQLEMWSRSMRTDETPGAYNVEHDGETEESGGA